MLFDMSLLASLVCSQICDCQHQFARWEDGQQRALPCLGGCKGPGFTGTLLKNERDFHRSLEKLRSVDKGILDVKDTTWCNEFNRLSFVCFKIIK